MRGRRCRCATHAYFQQHVPIERKIFNCVKEMVAECVCATEFHGKLSTATHPADVVAAIPVTSPSRVSRAAPVSSRMRSRLEPTSPTCLSDGGCTRDDDPCATPPGQGRCMLVSSRRVHRPDGVDKRHQCDYPSVVVVGPHTTVPSPARHRREYPHAMCIVSKPGSKMGDDTQVTASDTNRFRTLRRRMHVTSHCNDDTHRGDGT